jgi:GNAT superfamily N-acetyltransferase
MPIRFAQPEDALPIARVHVASWRTSYTGLVPESFFASRSVEYREKMWREVLSTPDHPTRLYVAVDDDRGEVVGFVAGGPNRDEDTVHYDGELYAIYLLESAQGKGYGRGLAIAMANYLLHAGFKSMILWVFEENPRARRFYEGMGGVLVSDTAKEFVIDDKTLREVAYGWQDLSRFPGVADAE